MAERPKPRILFVALVNNVGCERIIAEMSRHGALCAVMSPQGYYCTKLECSSPYFPLPDLPSVWLTSQFVRRRLESAVRDWDPVLVVPLDDVAAWLLRSLALDRSATRRLRDILVESLGSPGGYAASIHRGQLMQVAARIGARKPRHWHVAMPAQDVDVSAGCDFPLFLKIDHTCGGDGVTALNDVGELRSGLASRSKWTAKGAVKSWTRDLLCSLAGFRSSAEKELLLQSFAPGRPAFRTVAAWKGRVLAAVSFAAEKIHPEPTGASTVIRFVENREMEETAAALTAGLECSGFVSYDFMLDEERNQATLIEMNPRCVGSGHLGRLFGHDVCGALVAELTGSDISRPSKISTAKLVALFPKEVERDPASPYLKSPDVYHDVPVNESALMDTYLKKLVQAHPFQAHSIHQVIERRVSRPLQGLLGETSS